MVEAPKGDRRRGSGLVESLVALLLSTGLLILMGGIVVRHHRVARVLGHRVEGVESARLTRDLVSLAVSADPLMRVEGGELFVRTFVGTAERCGPTTWRYRGRRLPDPVRDSLWAVTAGGRVRVIDLAAHRPGVCPDLPDVRSVELEGGAPLGPEVRLVRVFESGRYRLDDALRYGRTGRGAQPLSAALLDPRRSGLREHAGGISAAVVPREGPEGYTGRWRP